MAVGPFQPYHTIKGALWGEDPPIVVGFVSRSEHWTLDVAHISAQLLSTIRISFCKPGYLCTGPLS